ncbi:MAG: fused MFS/spermidine synthase [Chitinispirillia bacterium]|nr:fused MFS/spermidine synthase [Chitinispirillia bacterium]MCL2268664.1 fused MFS/spermidine synthase [Chitinispirillia bacterium]
MVKNIASALSKATLVSYVYFALFFISGLSGLIYESIWSQYLKQFLGHAAYSQTLVLVIYMGGMALGSWIAALGVSRLRNLLFAYALVEIALGLFALAFHDAFIRYADISFTAVIPYLNRPLPITIYKWVTASVIILPQSILLGATFPLMAGGILRRFPGLSGYKTSVIYFVNTFGASAGVLISGFYLTSLWGLKGAIAAAGILDLFVGFAVLALCLNDKSAVNNGTARAANADAGPPAAPADRRNYYYPLLAVSCLTATASFIYEIGWIRMLSLVLGSSTHSFELMLSAFILGLALGSFFIRNRLDSIKNTPRFLGIIQIIMGATAIMTLFTYGNMFRFMSFTIDGLDVNAQGYVFFNIVSHLICMTVMLPTTVCAGMTVPLIIHMLYKNGYGEQAIGKVYAVNTAGGILGVVVAVWVLMESFGLKYLITAGAALDIAIGLYVLRHFSETRRSLTYAVARPAAAVVLLAAVLFAKIDPVMTSSGVFRHGVISKEKHILGHIDGKTASITLFRSGDNFVLSTNGKPDASVGAAEELSPDEYTASLLAMLPLSIRHETRTAAIVGMGSGIAAHYMLYETTLERLDVVEIEPAMVKLAKKIGPKVASTFNDPRSNIHIEDAKTFFSAGSRSYDVIISAPSNPWVSGVSSLFSVEFYRHIRSHLNDGGLLVQWCQAYESDMTVLASVLKALGEYFPVYDMYMFDSNIIIIAAKDAATDISIKRDVFEIAPDMHVETFMWFLGVEDKLYRVAGSGLLRPFVNADPTPANTNFHSFVDRYAVKHRFMNSRVKQISDLRKFVVPVNRIIFADTSSLSLSPNTPLPDIHTSNLIDVQKAKTLASDLALNAADTASPRAPAPAPVLILNDAAVWRGGAGFVLAQQAITQILQETLPYLPAADMRRIWDIIEKKFAGWEFSEPQAKWMAYYKSLCTYDAPEMRRLSLELLPQDEISPELYSNRILMASLLASSAVTGDTAGVRQTWEKYTERARPEAIPTSIRAAKLTLDDRPASRTP